MPRWCPCPCKQQNELVRKIEKSGYYPALVSDVLGIALADEPVVAHLVQSETTFDVDTIRRHLSVVVLTGSRLIFVHADDHGGDEEHGDEAHGIASSESVPLSAVRSVMVTHVVPRPEKYRPGTLGRELTLTIGWGAVSRVDLEPATCGDPQCEADHGMIGQHHRRRPVAAGQRGGRGRFRAGRRGGLRPGAVLDDGGGRGPTVTCGPDVGGDRVAPVVPAYDAGEPGRGAAWRRPRPRRRHGAPGRRGAEQPVDLRRAPRRARRTRAAGGRRRPRPSCTRC